MSGFIWIFSEKKKTLPTQFLKILGIWCMADQVK